jgi:hypothetical protein
MNTELATAQLFAKNSEQRMRQIQRIKPPERKRAALADYWRRVDEAQRIINRAAARSAKQPRR